jgi:hypothetical protein
MPRTAIAADASVDDVATGAVLKLTAKDKGQIGALRHQIREDVRELLTWCRHEPAGQGGGAPEHQ